MPKLQFAVPTPIIGVEHPTYGHSAPPFPTMLDVTPLAFARKIERDLARRSAKPITYHTERLTAVALKYKKLLPFKRFLVESDFAEMTTMCDIGERAPVHSQADEGKPVGSSFVIKVFPDVMDDIIRRWKPLVARAATQKVSTRVPANTNLGWPYLIADTKDKMRAFVLALIAASVESSKASRMSLKDVHLLQENSYGPRFLTPASRVQHSSKPIPIISSTLSVSDFTWTQNYEGRVRYVAMGGKTAMFWNKYPSKLIINAALLSEHHGQDRPKLLSTVKAWIKRPGWTTVALDVSGFDGGIGGENLKTFLSLIAKLVPQSSLEDLVEEAACPMLVPFLGAVYRTTTPIAPQLPSGVSYTTAVALLAGDYIALSFAKLANLTEGKTFFYKNWGDDFLLHFPNTVPFTEVLAKMKDHTGLTFDREPTIKYLGFNYGSDTYETRDGYSVGRLMLKTLLPERKSAYPFGLIGYAARLHYIPGDREQFHFLALQHLWDPIVLGPPFPYSEIKTRLEQALRDAADAALVDTDVLNFLTHGADDAIQDVFGADLGVDFDFTEWIGNSFMDLTDPEEAMRQHTPELFKKYRMAAKQALTNGFVALPAIMDELKQQYNWRTAGLVGPLF
jgi:hypothetical protein